ncbi:uncharacterized protein N7496_009653 [Penicillium cataractarum]|uniref:Uncharacterized protein n=1 Tax=Penicillium cataractarum TaxID=2100454 RepID=A0A9W9V2C8_9EURO|nr:uncharacterized protein N7496_009653 [Penicillium cataractarum]KAJ5363940.1 hypothetical protein N7496_009653 [Penicillium cataractarum]
MQSTTRPKPGDITTLSLIREDCHSRLETGEGCEEPPHRAAQDKQQNRAMNRRGNTRLVQCNGLRQYGFVGLVMIANTFKKLHDLKRDEMSEATAESRPKRNAPLHSLDWGANAREQGGGERVPATIGKRERQMEILEAWWAWPFFFGGGIRRID